MVFNIYFVNLTQILNQKDKTEFSRYIGSRRRCYLDKEAIEPYGALPRSGYLTYAARLKGLKRLKGILAPGVSGYALNSRLFILLRFHVLRTTTSIRLAHLALTFDKFGCTRHRQNLKTAFFILRSALVCLTLTVSKLGGGSEKCKQVCFFAHLALTL